MSNFLLKKKSVVFSWMSSYFFLLLIPVLVSIAIYYNAEDIIRNEINSANNALLQQIQQVIDGYMQDVEQLSYQIGLNVNIQSVINVTDDFDGSERIILQKVIKDLHIYKTANSFIDSFFIYLNNHESIITPLAYYDKTLIADPAFRSNVNYKGLMDIIGRNNNTSIFIFPENQGIETKNIVYCKPIISASDYKPEAKIVFLIDINKFLKAVNNIGWPNKGTIMILDAQNRVIASTQQVDTALSLKYADLEQVYGIKNYTTKNEDYTVSYIESGIMKWKYISVIQTNIFERQAYAVRNFTIISLVITLIIGAVISTIFTRKQYNPISRLVQVLSKVSGLPANAIFNEYNYIEDAVHNTIQSKERIEELMRRQNKAMHSNLIINLLKGKIDTEGPVHDILASYDSDFLSDEFIVMMFYIENSEGILSLSDNQSHLRSTIKNVVEEHAGQRHRGYVVEVDDIMTCLLNLSVVGEESTAAFGIAEDVKAFFSEKMDIHMSIAISRKHEGLTGIAEAYNEAVEIMGYRMFMENAKIIQYQDIQKHKVSNEYYNYPIAVEQQLINHIKVGDLEKSQNLLNDIFENNLESGKLSITLAKYLAFDLISTIVKTLDEMQMLNENLLHGKLNQVDRMYKCSTMMDMKREMHNILENVCTYIRQNQNEHTIRIMRDVADFVQEHYMDEDLSVSQIADQFQKSISYISKQFKKQYGDGLYDYINKIRVEKAKELLANRDCSISSIAKQVGFYNDNALIRVFKKYEGITPGKFKEASAKNRI